MKELEKQIKEKKAKIVVIGLGYVGLPVACLLARAGFKVVGLDLSQEKVDKINQGTSPIEGKEPGLYELLAKVAGSGKLTATTDYKTCKEAGVAIVAVETPVDERTKTPKYEALKSALTSLAKNLRKGSLVIIESTIAPGTMKGLVAPLLEKESGLKLNKDFYLGHCPERVKPGKLLHNLENYHRVVGGFTPETAEVMRQLYKTYVKGDLDLISVTTAEVVKTAENYYRDVEIAFANQLALVCEEVGVNVHEARRLVNKVEDRNVHIPGAGVGGHCIPKDGLLNVSFARENRSRAASLALKMADLAREINDFMPIHMTELLKRALEEKGKDLKQSKIAVLGYSYMAGSDDTRYTPTQFFLNKLNVIAKLIIHDPYVAVYKKSLEEVIKGSDALVFMVDHDEYKNLNLKKIKGLVKTPIIIDGRNIFKKEKAENLGFIYKGIGNV